MKEAATFVPCWLPQPPKIQITIDRQSITGLLANWEAWLIKSLTIFGNPDDSIKHVGCHKGSHSLIVNHNAFFELDFHSDECHLIGKPMSISFLFKIRGYLASIHEPDTDYTVIHSVCLSAYAAGHCCSFRLSLLVAHTVEIISP